MVLEMNKHIFERYICLVMEVELIAVVVWIKFFCEFVKEAFDLESKLLNNEVKVKAKLGNLIVESTMVADSNRVKSFQDYAAFEEEWKLNVKAIAAESNLSKIEAKLMMVRV